MLHALLFPWFGAGVGFLVGHVAGAMVSWLVLLAVSSLIVRGRLR